MSSERSWAEVAIKNITVDGNANGYISVNDTFGFYVKSKVSLKTSSTELTQYQVNEVVSKTVLRLGKVDSKINEVVDLSQYTVAAGSQILAYRQNFPLIDQKDITNGLYAREPIVANRVINVDKYGNYYDATNPLSVNVTGGSISGGLTDEQLRASPVAVTVQGATFEITGGLRVALDAFQPTNPDSVLLVGSSDGTVTGTKRGVIVTAANAVKVDGSAVTQPISAVSLPLPTDAATSLLQAAGNASLTSIDSKLSSPLPAGTNTIGAVNLNGGNLVAVKVDGSAVTQPVSVASLPLPSGAASAALQTAGNSSLASIDNKLTAPLQVLSINELIPMQFDQVVISSKNVNGDPLVILYKLATVTVATLTCTYDIDGDLTNVVRT